MTETWRKFKEMLNDIAQRDHITKFNVLSEMTGINPNIFTRIKKNEDMEISEDYFWRLNKAFGDRYNIKWFQGDSPYMTVKEAIESKDKLPVSQIMPNSSAEIIASLKREMASKEESFRLQLAAKEETIVTKNAQLTDKDRIIEKSEQTIKALQDQIADLRHLLAQKMTKDELDNYPFVIGVADEATKPKRKRI
jgi:hypothetical protein